MINLAPPASNSVYGRENGFDITYLFYQNMCGTVVQWSRSCLQGQINRVLLPATLISVTLCRSFFSCVVFFLIRNPFLLFSFILTTHPADHALGSIYILSLSQESFISKVLDLHTGQAYGQKKT